MIELHSWPTPNGHKITLALEEMGLAYRFVPVDIGRSEQFNPSFLAFSPNNRIPAIIDHAPACRGRVSGAPPAAHEDEVGGAPITVFESGAILLYLAEKTGMFLPADLRGRVRVMEWLAWQVGGLGPMAGQCHHFRQYAPEPVPYGIARYTQEVARLYGVMDRALAERPYLAGDYSIADMAAWPWVRPWSRQGVDITEFPNVQRWMDAIAARPAAVRAVAVGAELVRPLDDEARKSLFGPATGVAKG